METDPDDVDEVHPVAADADALVGQVGKDLAVTGTRSTGAPGGAPRAEPDPGATGSSG